MLFFSNEQYHCIGPFWIRDLSMLWTTGSIWISCLCKNICPQMKRYTWEVTDNSKCPIWCLITKLSFHILSFFFVFSSWPRLVFKYHVPIHTIKKLLLLRWWTLLAKMQPSYPIFLCFNFQEVWIIVVVD